MPLLNLFYLEIFVRRLLGTLANNDFYIQRQNLSERTVCIIHVDISLRWEMKKQQHFQCATIASTSRCTPVRTGRCKYNPVETEALRRNVKNDNVFKRRAHSKYVDIPDMVPQQKHTWKKLRSSGPILCWPAIICHRSHYSAQNCTRGVSRRDVAYRLCADIQRILVTPNILHPTAFLGVMQQRWQVTGSK